MNKRIVYVTGCLGFIGAYVTKTCLKQKWHVIGVDKVTYAGRRENLMDFASIAKEEGVQFKFIESDINELKSLYDCDVVINCAAETHVDNSIVSSNDFIHSNINGVHHLLELIRLKGLFKMPTFFQFSTDETYGDNTGKNPHTETHLLEPSNPYAATKAAADMLVLSYARTYKIPFVIFRPTNNYGLGQYVEKLIPKSCKYIQLGRKIPLHNFGRPKRMWLHAQDTADAVIRIIKLGKQNEIYNVSGTTELRNCEVVSKITKLLNKTDDFSHIIEEIDMLPPDTGYVVVPPSRLEEKFHIIHNTSEIVDFSYNRKGQDMKYALDDTKLQSIGWKAIKEFDKELPSIVEFYKSNFIW